MNRSRPNLVALLALCALALAAIGGAAKGAMIKYGPLVLRADGGFTPQQLPRRSFAPISFQGHAEIRSTNSKPPPALRQVRLDFDRDGRVTTAGLPVCEPSGIEGLAPAAARQRCPRAIVGTGHVGAVIALPGQSRVNVRSPLTLFNGPRRDGNLTVIVHAQATYPAPETYVVVVPVEHLGGFYSYRSTFDVPPIAGGYGALTHIDAKIGKRYRFAGKPRSYISARCSDGIFQTQGKLWFTDGTILSGSVFKGCTPID